MLQNSWSAMLHMPSHPPWAVPPPRWGQGFSPATGQDERRRPGWLSRTTAVNSGRAGAGCGSGSGCCLPAGLPRADPSPATVVNTRVWRWHRRYLQDSGLPCAPGWAATLAAGRLVPQVTVLVSRPLQPDQEDRLPQHLAAIYWQTILGLRAARSSSNAHAHTAATAAAPAAAIQSVGSTDGISSIPTPLLSCTPIVHFYRPLLRRRDGSAHACSARAPASRVLPQPLYHAEFGWRATSLSRAPPS